MGGEGAEKEVVCVWIAGMASEISVMGVEGVGRIQQGKCVIEKQNKRGTE